MPLLSSKARLLPFLVAALPLTAQEAGGDTTALAPIVVTAHRVPTPIARVSATLTVLNGARLRAAGIVALSDALRTVPGLTLVRNGSIGAVTSLFSRGGEGDYTKVMIDGVAINDPGGALDLSAITLDHVERIEIVRGPSSVLYGSDAVSATINVITTTPRATSASLELGLGSYGSNTISAQTALVGSRARGIVGVARQAGDGILAFNNQYANSTVSARAMGGVTAPWALSLRGAKNDFHYPTDGAGRIVDRNARRSDRRMTIATHVARSLGRVAFGLSAGVLDALGSSVDPADSPGDTVGFFAYRSRGSLVRHNGALTADVTVLKTQRLVLGAEAMTERQRSADSSNYDVAVNRFAARRNTKSLFAQWLGGTERASFSVGARRDDNNVYGVFHTVRASGAFALATGVRVRGSIGNAFKAPTFFEQFSTAFSIGNRGLLPERSRSWELAADVRRGAASGTVVYFAQRFRDLIQYTYKSPTDPSYFNVAAATASGLELEGRYDWPSQGGVQVGATVLKTEVEDAGFDSGVGATFVRGERLLRRPAATLTLAGHKNFGTRAVVGATILRVGERDDRNFSSFPAKPVVLRGYTKADLSLQLRLTRAGAGVPVALLLRADNVAGARYHEVFNFASPQRYLTAAVRVGAADR